MTSSKLELSKKPEMAEAMGDSARAAGMEE
jgi:hypothetical protein